MLSTVASYKMLTQNIEKSLARVGAAPEVHRETEYYMATIGKNAVFHGPYGLEDTGVR